MLSYLRRVMGLKELSMIIVDWFGALSNNTMCSRGSWGWRQRLQLARVRQWDICPSLFWIDHPGLSRHSPYTSVFRIQHTQKDYWFAGSCFAAGDLAGYPKVFTGSLISSLSPACQLLLFQQGHSIALCGSQFSVCSFWGAISKSKGFEGVSTKLPVQFARALRG